MTRIVRTTTEDMMGVMAIVAHKIIEENLLTVSLLLENRSPTIDVAMTKEIARSML